MDPMESIKQGYFQECEELLLVMEEGLIAMAEGQADSETINAVFRAVHSIKGGTGAFGFETLVGFAHKFETVLDLIRSERLAADGDVVKVLLHAGDVLSDHVAAARGEASVPADGEVVADLQALSGKEEDGADESGDVAGLDFTPAQIVFADLDEPPPAVPVTQAQGWRIRFYPHASLYAKANEPILLLRALASLYDMLVATADMDLCCRALVKVHARAAKLAAPGMSEIPEEEADRLLSELRYATTFVCDQSSPCLSNCAGVRCRGRNTRFEASPDELRHGRTRRAPCFPSRLTRNADWRR